MVRGYSSRTRRTGLSLNFLVPFVTRVPSMCRGWCTAERRRREAIPTLPSWKLTSPSNAHRLILARNLNHRKKKLCSKWELLCSALTCRDHLKLREVIKERNCTNYSLNRFRESFLTFGFFDASKTFQHFQCRHLLNLIWVEKVDVLHARGVKSAATVLMNAIIQPQSAGHSYFNECNYPADSGARSIITINDQPRPHSRGQRWRFLGPRLSQRDRIAGLLLVRWYMSSLCAPYCVNRIFMIYTVGPGSLPSLSRFFFLPSPANRLAAVPFDITRHCDITIFATSLWRTHNWTLFNPGNPERLWAICTYT